MIKRLGRYFAAARTDTLLGLVLLLLAGGVELLLPWPIKWLVDCVLAGHAPPRWLAGLLDTSPARAILWVALAIALLGVIHKLCQLASQFLLIRAGLRIVRDLRCHVLDHLHHLSLTFHDNAKVGDLIYRSLYDSYAAQSILSGALAPIASGALLLVGIFIILLRLDWELTLLAAAIAPLLAVVIRWFGRAIDGRSKAYHQLEADLFSRMQESLSSIRTIQAFTAEPMVAARTHRQATAGQRSNLRLSLTQLAFTASVGIIMALATAAAVYVAAGRVLSGRLLVGDILVFLAYFGMLYSPLSSFAQSAGVIQAARAQLGRVFDILDSSCRIPEPPAARPLAAVRGQIDLLDVHFGYGGGAPVLRGLRGTALPGSVIALVGRTGAGKSTLASLLLRFHDPVSGAIYLDGHDLRSLPLRWLRSQVGIVLQDGVIFSGTIAQNIALGDPGAGPAQVELAARRAQAHDFITALPQGYDTLLGERGVNLSGGQRQRIAIARAFLKNAPILILDEPTSALDAQTETALVAAWQELMRGRTTFIIAHRLSTVRKADAIWVLDAGRIVERGTHEELLCAGTLYRELWRMQQNAGPDGPVSPIATEVRS